MNGVVQRGDVQFLVQDANALLHEFCRAEVDGAGHLPTDAVPKFLKSLLLETRAERVRCDFATQDGRKLRRYKQRYRVKLDLRRSTERIIAQAFIP